MISRFGLGKRFSELWRTTNNVSILTKNQKVAGSSPAKRTCNPPLGFARSLAR